MDCHQPTNESTSFLDSKAAESIASPSAAPTTTEPSSIAQSQTTPSFTLFPLLPAELRLKIWEEHHAQSDPQILELRICPVDADHRTYRRKSCFIHPHVLVLKQQSIPSILHTCFESREVGLKVYKSSFDVQNPEIVSPCSHQTPYHEEASSKQGPNIYWDPNKDIVHVEIGWAPKNSTAYIWGGNHMACFSQIKYVAMSQSTLVHCCIDSSGFGDLAGVFVLGEWNQWSELDRYMKTKDWKYYINRWDLVQCGQKKEDLKVVLVDHLGEVLEASRESLC